MIFAITVLLTAGIIGTVILFYQNGQTQAQLRSLEGRMNDIEKIPGIRRNFGTYAATNGLFDVVAVMLDAKADLDAATARFDTAMGIVNSIRKDPAGYDPERPAGARPVDNRH
jgi:hypothetical protein